MDDLGKDDVELARVTATATAVAVWATCGGDEAAHATSMLSGETSAAETSKYDGRREQSEPTSRLPVLI